MSRAPRPGAPIGSPEWRRRVSEGVRRSRDRRRQAARVRPQDLARLRESGTVPERISGFLESAEVEAEALLEALGGPDAVSPQRRALVEDAARVGLVLRAELARYVQTADPDAASRVGSLASARRASLVALGLDRAERTVPDLRTYLAERAREAPQNGAHGADAGDPEPKAAPAEERGTAAQDGREPRVAARNSDEPDAEPAERLDGGGGEP